jgi:hypothetical protein
MMVALASAIPSATSAEGMFYGLLRSRDLTPFGALRLDMRPAHAVAIAPRTWVIETELGYQNTWALSEEVEAYLTALESQGRHDLNINNTPDIGMQLGFVYFPERALPR